MRALNEGMGELVEIFFSVLSLEFRFHLFFEVAQAGLQLLLYSSDLFLYDPG